MLLTRSSRYVLCVSLLLALVQLSPAYAQELATVADTANPYGIGALWGGSDLVAKIVLLLLLLMSLGSWYVIASKLLEQSRLLSYGAQAGKDFWGAGALAQGAAALPPQSPFRFVADAAIDAVEKHPALNDHVSLNDWVVMRVQTAVDQVQGSTQSGMAVLATVGSISPFVGLFGTVWGIYHALTAIGLSGQASIDKVAGPVGEALIMTAIGLAVAVPAVLGYNWLLRRNKQALDVLRSFGTALHVAALSATPAASK
ncbi:MAG: MotA/TolQ/ExbB proton channel family protein [Betaproteobacteria bacterium]